MKILFVEDERGQRSLFGDKLGKITGGSYESTSTREEALKVFNRGAFDVVIIDLMLTQPQTGHSAIYEGIQLGEEIRSASEHAAIVMYSTAIAHGQESSFESFPQCKAAGADRIVSKSWLFNITGSEVGAWLKDVVAERAAQRSSARPMDVSDDIDTQAAVEVIGKDNVARLIRQLLPTYARDSIKALTAGYSGAFILWVESAPQGSQRLQSKSVLKISRSEFALKDELRRRPDPGSVLGSRAALPLTGVASAGDWYGAAIQAVKGAKVLFEFLQGADPRRREQNLARKLVREVLIEPAREAEKRDGAEGEYLMSYAAGAAICSEMRKLQQLTEVVRRDDRERCKDVAQFVERCLKGHWTFSAGTHQVCRLHGDLHTRNIMVAESSITVIDFARHDWYPRLFDFAALEVDLAMSVLDSGAGNDFKFDRINGWCKELASKFPFKKTKAAGASGNGSGNRLQMLRKELHAGLAQLEDVSSQEYAEVLLFQLLRYLRFPNITPAKKVLGVRLADRLLREFGWTVN